MKGGNKKMAFCMVALHKRQDLLDGCVELLNSEWPRSQAARLHSLEKSCDGLPYSLVMIESKNSKKEDVAGYCRLAKVVNQPKAVFIESVVVPTNRRGQGLGRHLMELAESHARQHGYIQIYLTTKDKQGFYQHLGYQFCKPVNTLNAQVLETCSCQLLTNTIVNTDSKLKPSCGSSSTNQETGGCSIENSRCQNKDELRVQPNTIASNNSNASASLDQNSCSEETETSNKKAINSEAINSQEPCQSTDSGEALHEVAAVLPPPPPPLPPPVSAPSVTVYWMMKNLDLDKQ